MKMKRLIPLLIFSIYVLASGIDANAQAYDAPPVTISAEKIRMDGKLYYAHKVIEKQTLYSISKAYGVSAEDIIRANPQLGEDGQLKAGSILLIPTVPSVAETKPQTDIPVEEDKAAETDGDRFDGIDYFIHKVKWYENLQSIAKKYKVSEELIIEFNNLESIYVKKRQELKIPDPEFVPAVIAIISGSGPLAGTVNNEEEDHVQPSSEEDESQYSEQAREDYATTGQITISLILPIDSAIEGENGNPNYLDFYSGALMAARELGSKGMELKMNIIDTQEYNSTEDIASQGIVDGSDFIIGPVYTRDIEPMLPYCTEKHMGIVSPLDPKAASLTEGNPYFIQVPVSVSTQFESIADWIKESYEYDAPVLVISEVGGTGGKEKAMAETALINAGIAYSTFSYNILQGRGVEHSISKFLDIHKTNHIVIASENEAFVNDAVRNLNTLCTIDKYNIRAYGVAKLKSFETIETEHYHNINLHLAMGYHVDYDEPSTMRFVSQYRALFNTEPTPFAFQGYDTFMFFAKAAYMRKNEGTRLEDMKKMHLLQSDMRFEKTGTGENNGYENKAVRRVVFRGDYMVENEEY